MSLKEKQEHICDYIMKFQKTLGLSEWDIYPTFSGSWSWVGEGSTVAIAETNFIYKTATLKFHEKWLQQLDLNDKAWRATVLHELIHIVNSGFSRLHSDTIAMYSAALKTALNDRWRVISEQSTVHMEKILLKEFENK